MICKIVILLHILKRRSGTIYLTDTGLFIARRITELASAWQKLKAADSRRVLCHTLKTYFDQNCDLSQTTKTLHIHTNTLRYRLQRVESITGLNINKLESMIQLYFGILTDL